MYIRLSGDLGIYIGLGSNIFMDVRLGERIGTGVGNRGVIETSIAVVETMHRGNVGGNGLSVGGGGMNGGSGSVSVGSRVGIGAMGIGIASSSIDSSIPNMRGCFGLGGGDKREKGNERLHECDL